MKKKAVERFLGNLTFGLLQYRYSHSTVTLLRVELISFLFPLVVHFVPSLTDSHFFSKYWEQLKINQENLSY